MPLVLTAVGAVLGLLLYMRSLAADLRTRQRDLNRQFTHVAAQLERRHASLERLSQLLRLALPEARMTADALARAAKTDLIALNFASRTPSEPRTLMDLAHARRTVEAELRKTMDLGLETLDEPGIARCLGELEEGRARIETAGRTFNSAVEMYNTARERFPAALFARLLRIGAAGPLDLQLAL